MLPPLIKDSHSQRLLASPPSGSRPVSGRTARSQVDKESDWSRTGAGSPRAQVLQGFPGIFVWMLTLSSDFSASMSVPRAVYAILDMWVERYPGDFVQPPEFPNLHALLAYLQVNVPGSDLLRRAQLLLPERQRAETTEPEAGAPAPEPDQDVSQEVLPAATLAPAAPLGPELVPAIPAMAAHYGLGRPVTPPDPLGPGQMVVRALVHFSATEESPGLLTFLDDQQGPAHELPPPASMEQAGSAPEQHLVLATTRKHVFPIALVALFVFLLFCVYVYNYILDLIK
ncbi:ral guanine nucleotide dissociation stimulator-like [Mustela putorius furo]|uniref:Ral guanine nucleotide dissociation stimulator-like n=1 Tax=Mustela putorius furo TaxID=9669 RepID=A0A8U0RLY5_MUSPF|nr:ral guanine nucleotide dissociation stimulator-like [Mustela putorius furo]